MAPSFLGHAINLFVLDVAHLSVRWSTCHQLSSFRVHQLQNNFHLPREHHQMSARSWQQKLKASADDSMHANVVSSTARTKEKSMLTWCDMCSCHDSRKNAKENTNKNLQTKQWQAHEPQISLISRSQNSHWSFPWLHMPFFHHEQQLSLHVFLWLSNF